MCGQTSWLPPKLALFLLALSGLSENLLRPQTQTHGGLNERILKLMFSFVQRILHQPNIAVIETIIYALSAAQAVVEVFLDMQCYSMENIWTKMIEV